MGQSSRPGGYQDPDEARPEAGQDSSDKLRRLLSGRRIRFWIVVLVAVLWVFAECTHRSGRAKASEQLPEFNFTTLIAMEKFAAVPKWLDPRQGGPNMNLCR